MTIPAERPTDPRDTVERASPLSSRIGEGHSLLSPGATVLTLLPELRLMMGAVTAAVVIAGLYFGREILIPLALAFLLGFVLDPLVTRLKRWGLPRAVAVIAVAALTLSMIALAGLFLSTQVSALSAQLPTYQTNIKQKLRGLQASIDGPGIFDGALKTFNLFKTEVNTTPATAAASADANKAQDLPPPLRVQVEQRALSSFQRAILWLEVSSGPLANAGIVLVFVVLILLDRLDLRDRLVRLWGGSLHRSTDAMDEAGARISRYLTMQLVVNFSYGVPMAAGLWLIGVPGALLWGAVAAVMRFVPYVGPMISAVFPLALAFAVDPGWSMMLWTLALIVILELVSNNLVEPWLYGASTGLSAISLMVSAIFWTALWGPVGLIMSTPLTVCLLVIGRYLPRLQFLDVLLGSRPALDMPTRIYQRLLAGDVEEAIELASIEAEKVGVAAFHGEIGLPVLRMATSDFTSTATAEHRHRVVMGMEALIEDLREQQAATVESSGTVVICIGGKWEVDTLGARMLADALTLDGHPAEFRSAASVTNDYIAKLDLSGARTVCLSYFSQEPEIHARHFCRRLRRRWPDLQIVLALWSGPPELLSEPACKGLDADAVVSSMVEAMVRIRALTGTAQAEVAIVTPVPEADEEQRAALRASGALDARARPIFELAATRTAEIFDVSAAMVVLVGDHAEESTASPQGLWAVAAGSGDARVDDDEVERATSMCGHVIAEGRTLVVPDVQQDVRFAGESDLQSKAYRFFAGAGLRDSAGVVIGTLCVLDTEPRDLDRRELRLLEAMAKDVMTLLYEAVRQWGDPLMSDTDEGHAVSATVGQIVPSSSVD